VSEGTGIDQQPIGLPSGRMDPIHKGPFMVALETGQLHPKPLGLQAKRFLDGL
jgi:hypothetical protein